MNRRPSGVAARDRGATAVEFALLVPLLLVLVFGIIDFGRALNAQITITQAAREGARVAALGQTADAATTRTNYAATGLTLTSVTVSGTGTGTVTGSGLACPTGSGKAGADATVTVGYTFSFVTPVGALAGLFGGKASSLNLTAQGVMPCEN